MSDLGSLGEAVEQALEAAVWLTDADDATKELARGYASYVDAAHYADDPEMIHKAYSVAGPNLQKTLTSLGLNPEARKELGTKPQGAEVDPIDDLKRKRAARVKAG